MIREGLTFDDVLLVPQHSDVESRSKIDLTINISKNGFETILKHPIIPANMKTVTDYEMAKVVFKSGGLAIIHRFMSTEEQIGILNKLDSEFGRKIYVHLGLSVGVKENDKEIAKYFIDNGAEILCIDVAHGDTNQCIEMTKWISKNFPHVLLISGNIATGAGAARLWDAGADIVKVGVGPGCFAAGTRILMSNGFYKNIEEIKPGNYVINQNGKAVKVTDAFSTGMRKIIKLRNNIFYEDTYVTPDHKFWIGDLNSVSKKTLSSRGYAKILDQKSKTVPKQSKYKWIEIVNLKQGTLLMPNNISFNLPETFSIDLEKRNGGNWRTGETYKTDTIITPCYESGYLFGTFLGDGNSSCTENNGSHSGAVSWSFGLEEKNIVDKLSDCIEKVFNKTPSITYDKNIIKPIFYYKPLADFLNNWGKKENKKLPENLLINSKEYLLGIYDGLLDSDGHYGKDGRNTLGNTSKYIIELFNVVNYLLFGIFPNNLKEKITAGGLQNCNIENCNQPYKSSKLKNGKVRLTKDYQVVKMLEYEELNVEVPVYDITVDCDTHSFIANNMIVHNSLCTTRIETGNGVPQLTAIMDVAEMKYKMSDSSKRLFIADGGVKGVGEIVKALCFADMVMIGNMFAGCDEAPGNVINIDGRLYKEYVGSSTHKANHIEGIAAMVQYKGAFNTILIKMLEGLRSGCSYQGAHNLTELKNNPTFIRMTSAGLRESHPHDVITR